MVSSVSQEVQFNLQTVVNHAIEHGILARRDHLALTTAMFSDTSLSPAERNCINQVFDFVRMGRVRLED